MHTTKLIQNSFHKTKESLKSKHINKERSYKDMMSFKKQNKTRPLIPLFISQKNKPNSFCKHDINS